MRSKLIRTPRVKSYVEIKEEPETKSRIKKTIELVEKEGKDNQITEKEPRIKKVIEIVRDQETVHREPRQAETREVEKKGVSRKGYSLRSKVKKSQSEGPKCNQEERNSINNVNAINSTLQSINSNKPSRIPVRSKTQAANNHDAMQKKNNNPSVPEEPVSLQPIPMEYGGCDGYQNMEVGNQYIENMESSKVKSIVNETNSTAYGITSDINHTAGGARHQQYQPSEEQPRIYSEASYSFQTPNLVQAPCFVPVLNQYLLPSFSGLTQILLQYGNGTFWVLSPLTSLQ